VTDLTKAALLQERLVFGGRALPPFGADQHIQRLQVGGRRADPVVVQQALGDQQRSAGRQTVVDAAEQTQDFVL
jgi:hypothetical protein